MQPPTFVVLSICVRAYIYLYMYIYTLITVQFKCTGTMMILKRGYFCTKIEVVLNFHW